MVGTAFINGKFYPNVNFVDSPDKAEIEIVYDRIEYNKEYGAWLYFYHNYLVATSKKA